MHGHGGLTDRSSLVLAAVATCVLAGCARASMDFFAAPEPGWQPHRMDRIAVVVLGESESGRQRIAEALMQEGRRRGATLLPLERLLADLPPEVLEARLDSGVQTDSALTRADSAASDTLSGRGYGALAAGAFRRDSIDGVLEISLEGGRREVDPGIEHTVYDCDQWVESRGQLVCLRPRRITFRGDTLFRPWASYDVRLRDPTSDRILWRGGAHTAGMAYPRASEMHRDLVEEIVEQLVEDGILGSAEEGR